jgi:glutamate-ammonia-ligase adenylyltransferase
VLKWLAQNGQIPRDVWHELDQAYTFLRNTEHRLQEFADQQTHDLPADELGLLRLALSMGFSDPQAFRRTLQHHLDRVHDHFVLLLESDDEETSDDQRIGQLHAAWQGGLADEPSQAALSAVGFADPQRALGLLAYLRDNLETRGLSSVGRQRLDKLIPRMLIEVGQTEQPMETLGRMVDVIKTIERRTSYLALLLENATVLTNLVKLVDASPWMATFLSRHPVLLDELMDPRTLYYPPTLSEIQQELGSDLRGRMQRIPTRDLELQIEQLCIFQQVNMLRVAAADVTGIMPLMRVSDYLSEIAAAVVDNVCELAREHLIEKHGQPTCRLGEGGGGLAVIGYGKLGGLELGYGSDLDLVFLHTAGDGQTIGGDRPIDNTQFFNRLGQRVVHILTSHTRAGKLYDIDMRLRPSGSSGALVSHILAFRDYQLSDAWTWEHQALIRARAICGDPAMRSAFEQIRREVLARSRSGAKLKTEVLSMRERMRRELLDPEADLFDLKQGPGGMVDIEFLVQYLVLLNAHRRPELVHWTDNVRLIQSLMETGVISENTAHVLKHAYLVYRAAAHRLSLQERPAKVAVDRFAHLQRRIQQIWSSVFDPA